MRDITLEDTIYMRFTTRAFATGIPTTLAGTPVVSIYEENNLTQITAGVSLIVDYDGVAGLNQVEIVATMANGYEKGKSYDLVITTGTVGGVSVVGEVVGSFTIGNVANSVWDEVISKAAYNVAGSAAKLIRELGVLVAAEGAVSGTPTTTSVTTNITGYDNDFFKDQVLAAYNGATMAGQGRVVTSYNGTSGVFTFNEPMTSALSSGDDVVIFSPHLHSVSSIQSGTTVLAESYAADGAAATQSQLLYMIWSLLSSLGFILTTGTSRKLDGTSTAMTFTIDDPDNPTDINRET